MDELLDRAFQLKTLRELAAFYPEASGPIPRANRIATVNMFYLLEHGLIEATVHRGNDGTSLASAKITAKGLDFLADDGGLGAILGVVTVRLHDDTIRSLLIDRVEKSDAPRGVKDHVIGLIKQAKDESLKLLVRRAVEEGIQSLPDAVQLIQGLLSNA